MAQHAKLNKRRKGMGSPLEMAQFLDAGVNKLKKRIRDIERLLKKKKDILPDTVIVEKERTLEALRMELETAELRSKAKKNVSKYRMIRFFERKKSLRKYKQVTKQLKEDPNNDELKEKLEKCKIDVCYVVNFPKTEKYIALYPTFSSSSDNTTEEQDKTSIRRETFRQLIMEQAKNETLPISFEDILKGKKLGKDHTGVSFEKSDTHKQPKKSAENHKETDTNINNANESNRSEEEEEDDFFE
ncbi:Efg1p PWA37_003908 [Arxiozyma heterogenica]|uniref:rRNA-processing protein EFG1 n=1 Tax=Arxiozyma heterogenica TaxID=278026 RepID=A0AAN7WPI0_9SACH|nr:hypothetical protein RI543_002946 [Kazachstania heterogenica]